MRAIEQRQKQIADGLAAGEQGQARAGGGGQAAHEELAKARERVGEVIRLGGEARRANDGRGEGRRQSGAERILAAAKADIDQQIARAREMLREQVAALAVAGAEKILRREVNAQSHAELLASSERDLIMKPGQTTFSRHHVFFFRCPNENSGLSPWLRRRPSRGPYAEAVFGLAEKAGAFAPWQDMLATMARVAAHPDMRSCISNPIWARSSSTTCSWRCARRISPPMRGNFVRVLIANDRLACCPRSTGSSSS